MGTTISVPAPEDADIAAALVEAHRVDTTDVHGIANTATLETQSGAQTKATAARDAAVATAATDASAKRDAAIAAAAADATTKANAAIAQAALDTDTKLGLRPQKDPCRIAIPTNVNLSSPGVLTQGSSPVVTIANGDPVLLIGQTNPAQNGPRIYNGASAQMTRTPDTDSSVEMKPGSWLVVTEGTYADKAFELKTDAPITLDTTPLTWDLASGGTSSSLIITYDGSAYAPRNTVTSSSTSPVLWVGPVAPTIGGAYAIDGVDDWLYTTEVS